MPGKVEGGDELLDSFPLYGSLARSDGSIQQKAPPPLCICSGVGLVWFVRFSSLSFSLIIVFFFSFFDLKEAPIISDKKCSLHLFVLFNFTVVDIC